MERMFLFPSVLWYSLSIVICIVQVSVAPFIAVLSPWLLVKNFSLGTGEGLLTKKDIKSRDNPADVSKCPFPFELVILLRKSHTLFILAYNVKTLS